MDDWVTEEEWEAERTAIKRRNLVQNIIQSYGNRIKYEMNEEYGIYSFCKSRVKELQTWYIEFTIKKQNFFIGIYDDDVFKEALEILFFEKDDDICEQYIDKMIQERKINRYRNG